jgi:hypothetical protein
MRMEWMDDVETGKNPCGTWVNNSQRMIGMWIAKNPK